MSNKAKSVSKDNEEVVPQTTMCVKKRNGTSEPVDLNKVLRAISRNCVGLGDVEPMRVATRTISGIYDGATTQELDELSIQTAAGLIVEEPQYAKLAARLLATLIEKEVRNQEIQAFSQSVAMGHKLGLVNDRLFSFVKANSRKLNDAIRPERDHEFEYFGLRTVYDRYLLKHPTNRLVIETPQQFFLRIACALAVTVKEALEMYRMFSSLEYLPSSPTLFNSGTTFEQLSSCFLVDSPTDDLGAIYDSYKDIALLSKFSGGIGLAYHRVRARGSLIKGTNGLSNGIVPWLKTLDSSVMAVNQCFAPDTRVFTAQGAVPIRDVKEGDVVLGISGQYREVTKKMTYNQTDPMVSIKVKHSVSPVQVTAGHPFYVIQGIPMGGTESRAMSQLQRGKVQARWVDAGNLQKGDYVAQTIPTEVLPVEGLTEDDARLYGILLGDGHQSQDGDEWGVSGNPETDVHLTFVREYLTSRGIHFWNQERGETYAQVRWATGMGAVRCGTTGRIVGRGAPTLPFSREDIYDPQGRKHISRRFRHLPKPQALAMVQGLIETDGCVSRGQEIQFTNTSEALVEGVRYQMLRLGVPTAGQFRTRVQDHTGTRSDGSTIQFKGETKAYDIRIPAVPELAEKVGCHPLTKKNWLTWQGQVFTRVKKVTPIAPVPFVIDLLVEGDESYMTTAGLAHNGGKRKGAACVYLEPWHADIEEFLELRENTGDGASRTHNLNLANWIPDLFMKRVETDGDWSLFDPKVVPDLPDLFGAAFEKSYEAAEAAGLASRTVKARDLYMRMLKTLAQTGNGWMTFKDKSNLACNQTALPGHTVHLSNLCTEILEVTSKEETAVCNLGSVNLGRHMVTTASGALAFDFDKLAKTVRTAVPQLDRVIDLNFYAIPTTKMSNMRWRPVGLGVMGLQDVFFQLRLAFDSPEARELSRQIAEEIYYHALSASCDLAEEKGAHATFADTRAARGELQFDAWGIVPTNPRWEALRARVQKVGLRNSLIIAIAPTATIASIAGCYECIEPQVSNLFKRETLSGDFIQINRYLVAELKALGLWTEANRTLLKMAEGSIQNLDGIPQDVKTMFRTVWEMPMRSLIDMAADRGAFIDQSQSLNLFIENPNIAQLSSMYMYAWKKGLKTTYYLRSRPATRIAKATVVEPVAAKQYTEEEGLVCSLENPSACDACQ